MKTMDQRRFMELAEAFGADLRRWPSGDAERARALLIEQPDLQAELDRADELDRSLLALHAEPNMAAMQSAVLAAIAEPAPVVRRSPPRLGTFAQLWQELGGFRLVAPTLAMALTLGVGLSNWFDPTVLDVPPAENDLASLALLDADDEELLP